MLKHLHRAAIVALVCGLTVGCLPDPTQAVLALDGLASVPTSYIGAAIPGIFGN